MDIIVGRTYSAAEVETAKLKAAEFRRNRYTTGSAHLDDMITLGKAVILCETHSRKFSPKKAHYRAHPEKRMRRVNGQCDVCRAMDLCFMFLNEKQADEEQMKLEKFNRAREYGHFTNS